ncbi:hypothetical protein BEWA_032090 [Theileria equi strain WA]|uniref:mRNA 5'-phosphatase n=1 Tax=Theileria equi strain WA TaxID=1537102 RepID=L0AZB5_THEEQ|nr:hypothetical protein BEWA_032090 [Theileria equi strain WA]AFZ80356.1 hypothetical protein BEWA_032090 [Theileria equi strain WA]|eukprot:XP_004830022.1 hypothetical protein BEWA_032090 [Theileria equi strain WA]
MVLDSLKTINGSSAISCDTIASRLTERLESLSFDGPLAEALQNGHFYKSNNVGSPHCSLEIEVRLGFIQDSRSDLRFRLPLLSDTLLSNHAPVRFVPGVSEAQYKHAKSLLTELSGAENLKGNEWTVRNNECTLNRFFDIPGFDQPIRISTSVDSKDGRSLNNNSREAIRKVKLLSWNVSSKTAYEIDNLQEEEEQEYTDNTLDYRIAVNLEYDVSLTTLPTTAHAKYCRRKKRDSFAHNSAGIRFDLTQTEETGDTQFSQKQGQSYEIELELSGNTVIGILTNEKLSPNDRLLKLKYYCSGLVRTTRYIRDYITTRGDDVLSGNTNVNSFHNKLGLADLRFAVQSDESADRYKTFVSPQLPLIGDYLFRTVAYDQEKDPKLSHNLESYKEKIEEIPGPFVVKVDSTGHKYVTKAER